MILFDPDLTPASSKGSTRPASPVAETNDPLPSARALTRFLHLAQAAVRLRGAVSVLLTTDAGIRRLNRTFRGKNKATDVLSFPAAPAVQPTRRVPQRGKLVDEPVAGDLAISVPTARKQAREHGHALGVEIKILMLHGLLHLAGYDHEIDEGQMARRERTLRAKLKLPLGLIERSAGEKAPAARSIARAAKSAPNSAKDDSRGEVRVKRRVRGGRS